MEASVDDSSKTNAGEEGVVESQRLPAEDQLDEAKTEVLEPTHVPSVETTSNAAAAGTIPVNAAEESVVSRTSSARASAANLVERSSAAAAPKSIRHSSASGQLSASVPAALTDAQKVPGDQGSLEHVNTPAKRLFNNNQDYEFRKVDLLSNLCLKSLVDNFERRPVLSTLPNKLAQKLVNMLPLNLNLAVALENVRDDTYWERRCKAHFKIHDPTTKGDRLYKSIYLEKLLQLEIEAFTPRRLLPNLDYQSDVPLPGSTNWRCQQIGQRRGTAPTDSSLAASGGSMVAAGPIDAIANFSANSLFRGSAESSSNALTRLQSQDTNLFPSFYTSYSQLLGLLKMAAPYVEELEIRQLRPYVPYTEQEQVAAEDMANSEMQKQSAALESTIKRLAASKTSQSLTNTTQLVTATPSPYTLVRDAEANSYGTSGTVLQERSPWAFYDRYRKAIHPIDLTGLQIKKTDPTPNHIDVQILFQVLYKLKRLRVFYGAKNLGLYACNQLVGASAGDLQNLVGGLKPNLPLRVLDLSGSKFSVIMVVQLAESLLSNSTLEHLRLNQNSVGQEGAIALACVLAKKSCALEILDLVDADVDHTGAVALIQAVADVNSSLKSLDLSRNRKIGDFGCKTILELLTKASGQQKTGPVVTLRRLNLAGTQCGIETALALANFLISNAPNPVDINLSSNAIAQISKDSYTFAKFSQEEAQQEVLQVLQKATIQKKKVQVQIDQETLNGSQKSLSGIVGHLMLQAMQSNKHVSSLSLHETSLNQEIVNSISSLARFHHNGKGF